MRSRKGDTDRKFLPRMAEHGFTSEQALLPDFFCVHAVFPCRLSVRDIRNSIQERRFSLHLRDGGKHIIVSVQDGAPVLPHMLKDLRFCFQDALPASQKLQMALADIGHHTDVRLRDPAQAAHFPEMVDPHLQNRYLRILRHGKDGKRYADLIVKISLRLMHPVFPGEHCRDELLGAGLSHTAGDSDHLRGKLLPVKRRDLPQRLQTVLHQDTGSPRILRQPLTDRAQRPLLEHIREEAVPVHPLSSYSNKNAVFSRLPGIDHHRRAFRPGRLSFADKPASAGLCHIFQSHIFHNALPSEGQPSG